MADVKIACQTITWGGEQSKVFPQVFDEVAAAGFAGVEIGFRHIENICPAELTDLLAARGLTFASSHIGGNLADLAQAGRETAALAKVLDYLEALGCRTLAYSGFRYPSADACRESLARDVEALGSAATACKERGVDLLYHNHNWEFVLYPQIMEAILAAPAPQLGFCPDIGWVSKAGVDVPSFLQRIAGRVGTVHFKDFASLEAKVDTVELGTGVAALDAAAAWIQANMDGPVWIIAEQDASSIGAAASARANAGYLQRTFAQ